MAETATAPIAVFKKRKGAATTIRKRPAPPPPASSDDSDYASDDGADGIRDIKRRRKGGVNAGVVAEEHAPTANLAADTHEADRAATIALQDDATRTSHTDLLGHKAHTGASRGGDTSKSNTTSTGASEAKKSVGPVKAPSNIRTVTFYDMKPDVCKDYKQTGFCGFGDSCKFLHAREDYKQGWELDRDWEISTKGKKVEGKVVSSVNKKRNGEKEEVDEDERLKDIPFACFICRGPYKSPIVTRCGHYFCEKCALGRYRTTASCAACGSGTGGVFNAARDLNKLLEKKRAKEAEEEKGDEEED